MGTKSREVLYGGQVRAAKMNAERARKVATEAAREADRAEEHGIPVSSSRQDEWRTARPPCLGSPRTPRYLYGVCRMELLEAA